MAEQTFRSPGFFEREIDLTQRTVEIEGVPAGIIGTATQGPAFVPVTLGSFIDFERSQFPNTQADVTKFLQIEKLENENAEFKLEILKLKSKLEHLRSAYYQNTLKIWDIRDGNDKKEKTEFIMKCQDENCNGYLSTSYKCGICDKKTCNKCLNCIGSSQEEHEAHVCKPEEVAYAALFLGCDASSYITGTNLVIDGGFSII